MEEVILARELLEEVETMIRQVEDMVSDKFVITEELLHQIKEDLEAIVND